jgi:hypothetical protein
MKSMQRKLLLSISTFIFALLAFTGATVAWFNLSDEVTIDGFDMNISTGENLLVLLPGFDGTEESHWTNAIDEAIVETMYKAQRLAAQGVQYAPSDLRLEPLTSLNGYQFYNRQLPNSAGQATYREAGFLYTSPTSATHRSKYFELNLTFRSDSSTSSLRVYLNKGDELIEIIETKLKAAGLTTLEGALRIAFVEETTLGTGVFNKTMLIYEQDGPVAPNNSFTRATNFHSQPTWQDVEQVVQLTTSARFNFTSETEANSYLFSLPPATDGNLLANSKTIKITLWLEGWDSGTTDALWQQGIATPADLGFTVSLNFKGIPQ